MKITPKKLNKIRPVLQEMASKQLYNMGCSIRPRVEFSSRVDQNSAEVYPDGRMVFNDEYIVLNRRNRQVMHNIVAHECAHLADPDPSGGPHDESFMGVYQRYGWGIGNDPLFIGKGELLTTPHYALACKKCGNVWFYSGRPRTTRYCCDDNSRLKLFDVYKNTFIEHNWRKWHSHNNKISKRDLGVIFK